MYSYSRKGYMRIAISPIMKTSVTAHILKIKGLIIAMEYDLTKKTQQLQLSLL